MKLNVDHPLYVIGFSVVLSAVFTAVVMSVQVATAGKIRRNEELRREKAEVQAFGLGDVAAMSEGQITETVRSRIVGGLDVRDPETGKQFDVLRAYASPEAAKAQSQAGLVGYAFKTAGSGFWAPIEGLMAVTPDRERVVGLVFLSQSETPGLGGRIAEDWFEDQFKGITVSPPKTGGKFILISRDKPPKGSPLAARSVDAITGATQTSMAVERFLNADLAQFQRAMAAHQGETKPK